MFEVEQKFLLNPEQQNELLEDATFLHNKQVIDTYYDSADFALTSKDWWLRNRNGSFELKIPGQGNVGEFTNQYQEIENETEIRETLGASISLPFFAALIEKGYAPFCTCTTTRTTYEKNDFTIVLDHVTFAQTDLSYDICEIERIVATKEEMTEASHQISEFAEQNHLNQEHIHGKVVRFLEATNPNHYQTLIRTGVITA